MRQSVKPIARSSTPLSDAMQRHIRETARRNGKEAELVYNAATGGWDLVVREVKK